MVFLIAHYEKRTITFQPYTFRNDSIWKRYSSRNIA
jgi:hypothetical protein